MHNHLKSKSSLSLPRYYNTAGFTLLEILLAVFIFGLIAAGAYKVSSIAHESAITIKEKQGRLRDVSLTFEILERDLSQVINRIWRDQFSNSLNPPLRTEATTGYVIQMIRGGWQNPLGLQRPEIQQVRYKLSEDKLVREHTLNLDNLGSARYFATDLLDGIKSVTFTFLDQGLTNNPTGSQPITSWPPQNLNQTQTPQLSNQGIPVLPNFPLPIAVEVTLELEDMGEITRLIIMSAGA